MSHPTENPIFQIAKLLRSQFFSNNFQQSIAGDILSMRNRTLQLSEILKWMWDSTIYCAILSKSDGYCNDERRDAREHCKRG